MKGVSLREVALSLGVVLERDTQVSGYQIDSRVVGPGELFFALAGAKVDGHAFLGQVRERGAIGAVVSAGYRGDDFGLELIRVADVREALRELARVHLEKSRPLIVGVTGSVGKTTAKDFIATLLGGKFRVGKTEGSYNSQLTLPLTILNFAGDEEVLVLEMGMSQPGELKRLVELAPPDIGVLTKVALAHAASFEEGILGIAKEKAEIFSHPKTKQAVFYHGFYEFGLAVATPERISFSLDCREADYMLTAPDGFIDERGVRAYQFELPFKEPHILHNFLAAVAVARALKVDWDEINRRAPLLTLPKMRFEQFERSGVFFVNDAYNANPESMRAALSCFPEPKSGGKKIAVLGTMVELGALSRQCHEEIGRLAQQKADYLLTFGDEAKGISEVFAEGMKPAEHFSDRKLLAERLKELMRPGDAVLVKASRSMQLDTIFDAIGE